MPSEDYCREIETHLCRKNDGHLIRIVGPSFDLVSRWAADGVPLKVALGGIDRYFERYYRKGPRRRPVRVDSCDSDVRDVFDEWRRAVGIGARRALAHADEPDPADASGDEEPTARRGVSLPAHLERAVRRLTSARATGKLGPEADLLIDRVSRELDAARSSARGLRGAARQSLLARLEVMDAELLQTVRAALDEPARVALVREADEALAGFRAGMQEDAYTRAREVSVNRLVRERFGLPTLVF